MTGTSHRNLVGLARVSTDAQDNQLQTDALDAAGCARVFTDKVSSRKDAASRPGLVAALDYLRPGDTLCVWQLDRLGRSTREILTIADDLHARGIGLRILAGTLVGDYQPTGAGKLFFTILSAFAEFERDQVQMRTMAGLEAARAQGRTGGRPTVMDADKLAAARARRERGESPARIARALGVSRASVYRHLAAAGPGGGPEPAAAPPEPATRTAGEPGEPEPHPGTAAAPAAGPRPAETATRAGKEPRITGGTAYELVRAGDHTESGDWQVLVSGVRVGWIRRTWADTGTSAAWQARDAGNARVTCKGEGATAAGNARTRDKAARELIYALARRQEQARRERQRPARA